jgi:COMPASS component SWD1
LAAGTLDGNCLVWDIDTNNVALILKGHLLPITSIRLSNFNNSWSRRGRHLLTSSLDWNCIIWDLETSYRYSTIAFSSPVLDSFLHPYSIDTFAAIIQAEPPLIMKFENSKWNRTQISLIGDRNQQQLASTMEFTNDGEFLLIGTTQGFIFIYHLRSEIVVKILKIGGSLVRQIHISPMTHKYLLVNSNDSVIRLYNFQINDLKYSNSSGDKNGTKDINADLIKFELIHKFHDVVSKIHFLQVQFSADEEYVLGAFGDNSKHLIHVWHREFGNSVKVLEGPQTGIVDIAVILTL